ncbi:MMPL family transporter [Nocardia sp. 004]|uniref:MMPL family transporter n=1 Tax=Nocardia sp. 004 TaxID=3385978 RepID=UPI00399F315A
MLTRTARLATRMPRTILAVAFLVTVLCGAFGATAASHLKAGGFISPDAESARVLQIMADEFGGAVPNFTLLVSSDAGVDDPATAAKGVELTEALKARPDIEGVNSYWTAPSFMANSLRSSNGEYALVIAYLQGDENDMEQTAGELEKQLTGDFDGITVKQGGLASLYHDLNTQITRDLAIAEGIAVPLSLIVLILVFGSLIAAALPVAVGLFAIVAALAILRLFTLFTDVSIYALNLTTAMGLALAIDYSLFIVSRFREELGNGLDPTAATVRAVQTAGRTVLFSAITVALSMAVLSVFDVYFLKSFAYAGVAVVGAAAVAAILFLPAALILLGPRVNALDLRVPLRRLFHREAPAPGPLPSEQTRWYRLVSLVMRHAAPVAIVIIAVLLALGYPFLSVRFGYPDDQVLPADTTSRQVGDILRAEFPQANPGDNITIVLKGYRGDTATIGTYATELSRVDDVAAVLSSAGIYISGTRVTSAPPGIANDAGTYLNLVTTVDPATPAGAQQLRTVQAIPPPGPALYGGTSAINADSLKALSDRLPLAGTLIALTTFIVLFLFTGSVVLPIKALALSTLSLGAAFGAMVWVFQEGHLSGLLGFTATGYLIPTIPILMFCLAFGLSMDYEVFLLSRVREEWLATHDNTHAIAAGVARTGRIFTAAALLMAIVFGALVTSGVSFIKLMGLGLTLTVLVDATIIRLLLAPALMRLLGPVNWWAPGPLVRLHAAIGLNEDEETTRTRATETAGRT